MKITPEPIPRNVLYPGIVAAAVTAAAALASCQPEERQALGGDVPFKCVESKGDDAPAAQPGTPSTNQNAGDTTKTEADAQPSPGVTEQTLGGDVPFERVQPKDGDAPAEQPDNS